MLADKLYVAPAVTASVDAVHEPAVATLFSERALTEFLYYVASLRGQHIPTQGDGVARRPAS